MLDNFDALKTFITRSKGCTIDNFVYRLHYRATVLLLVAFCIFVTLKQLFGNPINCITQEERKDEDKEADFEKVLNRFCWIHTTFSVASAWRKEVGREVPYPGVDKNQPEELVTYHAYYQWVSFVLILQAICFYIPHLIWKRFEASYTKKVMNGLDGPVLARTERQTKISMVSDYLYQTIYHHRTRFLIYVFTEILNFVNVVGQMFLLDRFLGGQFMQYGSDIMGWSSWTQYPLEYDPMMKVFPRLTKCTFRQYGPSGDLQLYDTMCVLPINIVNEKIYLFLWFWFYLLAIVTGVSLLYRGLIILLPWLRVTSLRNIAKCHRGDVQRVLQYSGIGDWFLMLLLAKNMDKENFADLIADLKFKLQEKEKVC